MDDKDFIIDIVKKVKGVTDIDKLDKYLTFDLDTKENIHSKIEDLIEDLKKAELPKKNEIINYNNNGEYQGYEFTLEPVHVKYLISITIFNNKDRKVNSIGRIKIPNTNQLRMVPPANLR